MKNDGIELRTEILMKSAGQACCTRSGEPAASSGAFDGYKKRERHRIRSFRPMPYIAVPDSR
jgi:hypothetical protein